MRIEYVKKVCVGGGDRSSVCVGVYQEFVRG